MSDGDTDIFVAGRQLFVVIGAQRTGTNILREILNTNEHIAMLGEVLTPSTAPAHWDNFCRALPIDSIHPATFSKAESLLDQYFEFVEYRIRNHWEGNRKNASHTIGVDIKYNQLSRILPSNWSAAHPFILSYLRSRRAILIHTTRNIIHCAISTSIASQRNLWHNYGGVVIDRAYEIDVAECLAHARSIVRDHDGFLRSAYGCRTVNCRYENLCDDLKRTGSANEILDGPGPLRDISAAFNTPFSFRNDKRLQKAIDVPYSKLLSNYNELVRRLGNSEFSALVPTLE
jgi:sulfotransferase family protein